jgi:hypothetical protein
MVVTAEEVAAGQRWNNSDGKDWRLGGRGGC